MKVLVISNNCFSNTQNMGKTLSSIFSSFSREEVCQLYFYSSIPDGNCCSDFYRVSDYDLVKGRRGGEVAPQTDQPLYENERVQQTYARVNRSNPLISFARTFLWGLGRWNSAAIHRWIRKMNPDLIFFASGDTVFSYKIVERLRRKYRLPVISYICDDFYHAEPKGILAKAYLRLLKRWMHRVFSASAVLATICDSLGEVYSGIFGVGHTVIHTGTKLQPSKSVEKSRNIAYLGNVSLNRWQSLIQLGEALERYNRVHGTDHLLEIYTGAQEEEILNAFGKCPAIRFCGRISYEQCVQVMHRSVAVVHTESFAPEDILRVKYSVSTKIADSLACGTCFFAYGSEELASIQYLQKHGAAVVATQSSQLEEKLEKLFDPQIREQTVAQALKLAAQNHIAEKNSAAFYQLCKEKVR